MTQEFTHWRFIAFAAVLAAAAAPGMQAQVLGGSTSAGAPAQAPAKPMSAKPAQSAPAPASQAPASQAPASQAPNWKNYSYASDGFSASFPSQPTLQKQNVPTAAGSFELRDYLVEDGQSALYVGVCDYGSAVSGRDPQEVLQGAMNGAVSNVQAHILTTSKIALGVYPGVTFEAESSTLHFSARIYLVGTILYQELTASPVGQPYNGSTTFLDSFQIIPRTAS